MDIKTTVEEKCNIPQKYPYFGKADNGLIVIFTSPKTGTVIVPQDCIWKQFMTVDYWEESKFKPLTPGTKITIEITV